MNFKMINISRKHKIAAVVILLVVGLLLVINSTMSKKNTLSVSSGTKIKNSGKTEKPANKKTKIADSNQLSKNGKPAAKAKSKKSVSAVSPKAKDNKSAKNTKPVGKKIRIADSNQDTEISELADMTKKSVMSKKSVKNNKIVDSNKTADVAELKKPAHAVLANADSNSPLADSDIIVADSKVADNNQIAKTEELADINVPVNAKVVHDSNKLMAVVLSEAKIKQAALPQVQPAEAALPDLKPKQIALSSNLSTVQAEIQSLLFARNMPITDALQLLGARYGKNIVPSAKVTGNITFTKLNNVSFEEAMRAILGEAFEYQQEGNLVRVYTAGETDKLKPKSSGMVCKVFTLYYISSSEAKKMIAPVLSTSGKLEITSDAELGVPADNTSISAPKGGGNTMALNDMLVVYDYPEQIVQVEKILAAIDIRPKQVLVEATILAATLTNDLEFGIDWQTLGNAALTGLNGLSDLTQTSQDFLSFGGSSAKVSSVPLTGGVTVGVVRGDLSLFIRAIEQVTDVTVLANPKILATNKQLGQVYIGTKVGYVSATTQTDTSTTQTVSFLDTGTKLVFRPYIGNDGYIRMDIHPKDSSASFRTIGGSTATTGIPDETSAELISNIIVKDGETIVIGGLFREKTQTMKKQVPVLGNLPVVGNAFSSKADEGVREEVIVLLTPHIINEPSQAGGDERVQDVQRLNNGAKKELHPTNSMKMAQDHYEKAATYYIQKKNDKALKELKYAIELYPTYVEAIQLQDKIYNEVAPSRKPARKYINEAQRPQSNNWRRE